MKYNIKTTLSILLTSAYFIVCNLTENISLERISKKKAVGAPHSGANNTNITANSSSLPKSWRFVNVYIFNVTNPENISEDVKPNLEQVGPYKYKITLIDPLDSVQRTYRYIRKYAFEYDKKTKRNESDRVNIINVPYVRLIQVIASTSEAYARFNESVTQKMLAAIKSPIILEDVTVAEIVSKGINVNHFRRSLEDFDTSILEFPKEFDGGTFYLFPEEIDANIFKSDERALRVQNIEGISKDMYEVGCWKDKCNMINGTDGLTLDTPFGPIFKKRRLLNLFYPDLYRSIKLNFSEEINDIYVYVLADDLFDSSANNKSNCFCELQSCQLPPGAFDVSPCKKEFPLVYSLPHFLDASSSYRRPFNGLRPDKGGHESFYRIDPVTGEVLFYVRRLQQNIYLKSLSSVLNESNLVYGSKSLENAIFPLLWTEEVYELIDRMERPKIDVNRKPKNNCAPCNCNCKIAKNTSAKYFHVAPTALLLIAAFPILIFSVGLSTF